MRFSVVGISHWKSGVSIREQFFLNSIRKKKLRERLNLIPEGVLVLDTCNRTELYGMCNPDLLIDALCQATGNKPSFFKEHGFSHSGEDAINHLYKVATGLDSQMLGDVQIIQQVKQAYHEAKELNLSGDFHQLIQSVFRAHKRSRNETEFGQGSASIGFAATQQALSFFGNIGEIRILLVGAGKMGKVSCKNLIANGAQHISVVNRTIDRAKEMAKSFDIKAHAMDDLKAEVNRADLIIAATGSVQPIIKADLFESSEQKKLVIDLSVPRNVEKDVAMINNVTLIDMDSITEETKTAIEQRKKSIPDVEAIIKEEKQEYLNKKARTQYMLPRIEQITGRLEDITDSELKRVKHVMDKESYEKLEEVAYRIKKKILAVHINRMEKEFESIND